MAVTPDPPTPPGRVIQANGVNVRGRRYCCCMQGHLRAILGSHTFQPLPSTTPWSPQTAAVTAGPIRQRPRRAIASSQMTSPGLCAP
jgi:hypothetical protein